MSLWYRVIEDKEGQIMAERAWPNRITILQDGYGGHNADVFDGDTGERLTRVFRVVVERESSSAEITMSKYDPDELALMQPEGSEFEQLKGVVVETRKYSIHRLWLHAGEQK